MNGSQSTNGSADLAGNNGHPGAQALCMGSSTIAGRSLPRHISSLETAYDWPGREHGIRKPYPAETALSWSEVNHFLKHGAYQ